MNQKHKIPRISKISPESFYRDFLVPQKPVIIENAADNWPIRRIDTLEKFANHYGDVEMLVRPEYSRIMERRAAGIAQEDDPTELQPRMMTVGDYVSYLHGHHESQLLCVEESVPHRMMNDFVIPQYVKYKPHTSPQHVTQGKFFFANAGNFANLHVDGDYCQVLMYQVVGRKHVCLVPPEESAKIGTYNGRQCMVRFDRFTPEEKSEFLRWTNGCEGVIAPGDLLFMPAQWFHYLEYLDNAVSIAVRFCRNRYRQCFRDHLSQSVVTQRLVPLLVTEDQVENERRDLYLGIIDAIFRDYPNAIRRSQTVFDRLEVLAEQYGLRPSEIESPFQIPRDKIIPVDPGEISEGMFNQNVYRMQITLPQKDWWFAIKPEGAQLDDVIDRVIQIGYSDAKAKLRQLLHGFGQEQFSELSFGQREILFKYLSHYPRPAKTLGTSAF